MVAPKSSPPPAPESSDGSALNREALAPSIEVAGARVVVAPGGGGLLIEVLKTGERYDLQSTFSYPNIPTMGSNLLAVIPTPSGEAGWAPSIERVEGGAVVTAEGASYRFERRIKVEGGRLVVTDTLHNKTAYVLGLAVTHTLMTAGQATSVRLNGLDPTGPNAITTTPGQFPENPTMWSALERSGIGFLAEDDALRLQSSASLSGNAASFSTQMLGIEQGGSYEMRWSLYPVKPDYFEFINRAREDLRVNFTVEGPWDFFDISQVATPEQRRRTTALLKRKRMKLFAMTPWFEYYDYWGLTRPKYREEMRRAMDFVRSVVPDAKFLACVETNLTPVPLSFFGDTIPLDWPTTRQAGGKYGQPATPRMARCIDNSVWRDSVIRNAEGQVLLDAHYVQFYTDPPGLNLMVYPMLDNHRQAQAIEQFTWLLDDVGFDGLYIDQFSLAYHTLANTPQDRYTYDLWDRRTVTLDATGNVSLAFGDLAILSADARRSWIDLIFKRGKIAVCNTEPAIAKLQHLPTFRFMETQGYQPMAGVAPYQWRLAKGQLASPIGLGTAYTALTWSGAEAWNRTVIAHLRFGLLHYYYHTQFPAEGPFGGEYGPVNHMFPFTPVELHEGWVLGKERLITCLSGDYPCPGDKEPTVLQFDRFGRERPADAKVRREGDGYRVEIKLEDWWEIAVVK